MKREDIEKLLGGYATDTLSAEERRALCEAALADQDLFNALVREQALRDLLQDPSARQQLLAGLQEKRERFHFPRWLRQPPVLALAGSAAVVLIVGTVGVRLRAPTARPPVLTAELRKASPAPEPRAPVEKHENVLPAEGPATRAIMRPKLERDTKAAPAKRPSALSDVTENTPRTHPAAAPAPPPAELVAVAQAPAAGQTARELYYRTASRAMSFVAGQPVTSSRVSLARPAGAGGVNKERAPAGTAGTVDTAAVPAAVRSPENAATVTPTVNNLGLRYSVLLKGVNGEYSAVAPATVFRPGDLIRLEFEPNDSGYLHVLQHDSTGGWRLLFGEQVERRKRYVIPTSGALQYEEPGRKELFVVLSRKPEPGLADLQTQQLEALASRARGRLLLESVQETGPGEQNEKAVYAVDASFPAPGQQVALPIILDFRQE